jgi:hypothetical protein
MYPWIPWELVADPKGSAEHTSGTTALEKTQCHIFQFPILNAVKNTQNFEAGLTTAQFYGSEIVHGKRFGKMCHFC